MAEDIQIKGIPELRKALADLEADLRRKVIIGALKDAAKPIVRAAKSIAPIGKTGLLQRSIISATSKRLKGQAGVIGVYVSVRKVKGQRVRGTKIRLIAKGTDPYYWKFQELGTKFVRAKHFLENAGESNFAQAVEIFSNRLDERIKKANQGQ